jgi:hypothetical protein
MLQLCALTTLVAAIWNTELLSTEFQTAWRHNHNTKDFDILQQWREEGRHLAMCQERCRGPTLVGVRGARWYINKLQKEYEEVLLAGLKPGFVSSYLGFLLMGCGDLSFLLLLLYTAICVVCY